MPNRRGRTRGFFILMTGALAIGACSSDSGSETATDASGPGSTAPASTAPETPVDTSDEGRPAERSITYLGVTYDQPDLAAAAVGGAGYWFAQFDVPTPVEGRPAGNDAVDALPAWAGPLNYFSIAAPDPGEGCTEESLARGCMPGFAFRTFSQDGPASSMGGMADWATLTLPDGQVGLSGAIVDPATDGNSNNTVNRIQLGPGVPTTFYFSVVTDNTAQRFDPTVALRARGNVGLQDLDDQVEPDVLLAPCDLAFNGTPDIYTFRFDGFAPDDYIKLRLAGSPGSGGASFAGVLFDESFDTSELQLPDPGADDEASGPAC